MPLDVYLVEAGGVLQGEACRVVGVCGVEAGVNLLAFYIRGGVLDKSELRSVVHQVLRLVSSLDKSKPILLSGRGPHWLYMALVDALRRSGFKTILAYDPRLKAGVVVYDETGRYRVGDVVSIDGRLVARAARCPRGTLKLVEHSVCEDSECRVLLEVVVKRLPPPNCVATELYEWLSRGRGSAAIVVTGNLPVWAAAVVAGMADKHGFYEPTENAVIMTSGGVYGETRRLREYVEDIRCKKPLIVGVVGDPNSGKSVFIALLNRELRRRGLNVIVQEGDVTAPTQEWSLHAQDVRKALKQRLDPAARLAWITRSLANLRQSCTVDVVLVDMGGGDIAKGERMTRWNLAIARYLDGIIIVSRDDQGNIKAWLDEIRLFTPDTRIYYILASSLEGRAAYNPRAHCGIVVSLDRNLYKAGLIPQETLRVVADVADKLVRNEALSVEEALTVYERILKPMEEECIPGGGGRKGTRASTG